MAADYYVSTTDGRVHPITGVTTVAIVTNDGVATVVYDGVWRNVIPFSNTGDSASAAVGRYGPGWSIHPIVTAGSPVVISDYEVFTDDVFNDVAPRNLEIKISMWKFTTPTGNYFIPVHNVVAMSNTTPTY